MRVYSKMLPETHIASKINPGDINQMLSKSLRDCIVN
jgi:hypothetical protein